eukprot:30033-Rhodomonas_salina.1
MSSSAKNALLLICFTTLQPISNLRCNDCGGCSCASSAQLHANAIGGVEIEDWDEDSTGCGGLEISALRGTTMVGEGLCLTAQYKENSRTTSVDNLDQVFKILVSHYMCEDPPHRWNLYSRRKPMPRGTMQRKE